MATKLYSMVTYFKQLPGIKLLTLWSCGLARTRDKLKPLYNHSSSAYGHQPWHCDELSRGNPFFIVTSPFNHVVLLRHMTN